jgi:uncharacterized membrane protein YfcA
MTEEAKNLVSTLSIEIINPLIGLLLAVALAYFIYGVVKFIANADNDTAREKGKQHILYSIIGLVIMVGVWGILNLLMNVIGPENIPDNVRDGYDQL